MSDSHVRADRHHASMIAGPGLPYVCVFVSVPSRRCSLSPRLHHIHVYYLECSRFDIWLPPPCPQNTSSSHVVAERTTGVRCIAVRSAARCCVPPDLLGTAGAAASMSCLGVPDDEVRRRT